MPTAKLTTSEKIETIRSLVGLVKRLYQKDLPDDFNVLITVRSRSFKRMEVLSLANETTVVEPGLSFK